MKNLLFISIDTFRFDRISSQGHFRPTTPFIDSLISKGIIFTNMYTQAVETPVSHRCIFSGKFPRLSGINKLFFRKHVSKKTLLLSQYLKENGYYTVGFPGSFALDRNRNFNQGFLEYYDKLADNDLFYIFHYGHLLVTFELLNRIKIFGNFQLNKRRRADRTIDLALNWLQKYNFISPFFMFIHFFDTHCEYLYPDNYKCFHAENPKNLRTTKKILLDIENKKLEIDEKQKNFINTEYDNSLRFVDYQIERLINFLEKKGLLDETIIIITGDHGEGLGDHGYWLHGCKLYKEEIHIPCIIFNSNIQKSIAIDKPLRSIDIFPTIIDLLNLPQLKNKIDGLSIIPLIKGEEEEERIIFVESRHPYLKETPLRAIQFNDWKYIYSKKKQKELYYLKEDKLETINLYKCEPTKVSDLLKKAEKLLGIS